MKKNVARLLICVFLAVSLPALSFAGTKPPKQQSLKQQQKLQKKQMKKMEKFQKKQMKEQRKAAKKANKELKKRHEQGYAF